MPIGSGSATGRMQGLARGPDDALRSLGLLATGLAGRPLALQALAPAVPGALPARPVLTATHLLLPADYTSPDAVERTALYRAAVAHAVAHLHHSVASRPSRGLKPMTLAVMSAVEDARVEHLLMRDHPGVRAWFVPALAHALRPQALDAGALISRMDLALADPAYRDDNHWVHKARALFAAQPDLHDYAAFRRIASVLANDLGQMRVPFRAEHYAVPAPYRDDNTFLWTYDADNAPSPPVLELDVERQVPAPLAAADGAAGSPPATVEELELGRTLHPEWDHRLTVLRPDWCTVIDKVPAWQPVGEGAGRGTAAAAHALPVRLRHARSVNRARRLRRQWEGPEIDLNAAIEVMVDQRMRRAGDARFFMRAPDADRHASILVLLDLSASTNDPVGDGRQTLLDIEKHAALMLADAAMPHGDRVAIHGFSSNTRADVSYYRLLEFGAALDGHARAMIASAPGRHSTRMGSALRHATACLASEAGELRAILLVTDGAPSDVDVHDSRYLREDARAAVLAARAAGIQVHCLAVDRQADDYVRPVFGWRGYRIVDDPLSLASKLQAVYGRLTSP